MRKIQIRRGLKADLPQLDVGEFGFCTNTKLEGYKFLLKINRITLEDIPSPYKEEIINEQSE